MQRSSHSAFTIVEALVATAIVGLASAAFAVALAANGSLRAQASARVVAAQIVAARLASLAARRCAAPDTGGIARADRATESWRARRIGAAWSYTNSITTSTLFVFRATGMVSCRP